MSLHTYSSIKGSMLAFISLGGAGSWLLHFVTIYIASEFGCATAIGSRTVLGFSVVAWIIGGFTAATFLIAVYSLYLASKFKKDWSVQDAVGSTGSHEKYIVEAGIFSNAFFALFIALQTVPLLYFLESC